MISPETIRYRLALGIIALSFCGAVPMAQAQDYASVERRNAAIGYYSRARALMVEALAEFEQGRKYAQPDLLIDTEEWRLTTITLTEQLNRVIDPKPRVTKDGVIFRANPRLIRREKHRLPPVPDGAQDSNIYGEQQRMKELQASRARLYKPAPVPAQAVQQARNIEPEAPSFDEPDQGEPESAEQYSEGYEDAQGVEEESVQQDSGEPTPSQLGLSTEPSEGAVEQVEDDPIEGTEAASLNESGRDESEDQKIASAIEDAIKDRLKSLEVSVEEDEEE